jgi:hypothetical protein
MSETPSAPPQGHVGVSARVVAAGALDANRLAGRRCARGISVSGVAEPDRAVAQRPNRRGRGGGIRRTSERMVAYGRPGANWSNGPKAISVERTGDVDRVLENPRSDA